jgi:GntR family transcriptional regulator, galactonate operon transcriptional repressor
VNVTLARNLTQQIAESLGVRIVKGEIQENDIITAGALQDQYGVSRTVVREAIQILQSKGLVQSRTKTGTTVLSKGSWNLLDADVISWYRNAGAGAELVITLEEVRESYEPWAARMAARRRSDTDLENIRSAYELMVSSAADEAADSSASVYADLAFHQAILESTHNDIIVRLGMLVRPVLQIRNEMALHNDTNTDFLEDHLAVLEAIEKQQPAQAEKAMRSLLERSIKDTANLAKYENDLVRTNEHGLDRRQRAGGAAVPSQRANRLPRADSAG